MAKRLAKPPSAAKKKSSRGGACVARLAKVLKASLVALVVAGVGVGITGADFIDGMTPMFHLHAAHGFAPEDVPSLEGKAALVTGASSGLGLGVAKLLALRGASLTVTARDADKCAATLATIRAHAPGATVHCVELELMSLHSVATATVPLLASMPKIDLLVLNAGLMCPPQMVRSSDGLESQFQVNHLSQFLLLNNLLASLYRAPAPRVVFVSSAAHWLAPRAPLLSRDDLTDASRYSPTRYYGWSKLCNLLTARELSRREPRIVAHAVHPGAVRGKLFRHLPVPDAAMGWVQDLFFWDADTAALTVARPLVDEAYGDNRTAGSYFVPIARPSTSTRQGSDAELGRRLWDFSAALAANFTFSSL